MNGACLIAICTVIPPVLYTWSSGYCRGKMFLLWAIISLNNSCTCLSPFLLPNVVLCILRNHQCCISEKKYLNIMFKMSSNILKIKPKGIEWREIEFWFCTDGKLLLYNSHFPLLRYHNLHLCLPLFSFPMAFWFFFFLERGNNIPFPYGCSGTIWCQNVVYFNRKLLISHTRKCFVHVALW